MEHFLHRNVPLRHLLNAKPLITSWRRSVFNEVNDLTLRVSLLASTPKSSGVSYPFLISPLPKNNNNSFIEFIKKKRWLISSGQMNDFRTNLAFFCQFLAHCVLVRRLQQQQQPPRLWHWRMPQYHTVGLRPPCLLIEWWPRILQKRAWE